MTRSSDLGLASDPLGYLLRRRLGITSAFSDSEAMNRGSWGHRAFHHDNPVMDLQPALAEKIHFLREACARTGADFEKVATLEQQDFDTACSWFQAARTVRFLDESEGFVGNYDDWLNRPGFDLLGIEVLVVTPMGSRELLAVAQLDMLYFHHKTHTLRPLDIKTSAYTPRQRFARCLIEPQVHHYTRICHAALPMLIKHFDLPGDTKVDGMYHLGMQKPTIKMCGTDRNFDWKKRTLTRDSSKGKKGDVISEKVYYGEPLHSNFVARCRDWMHGEGEYTDKKPDREADPPVNVSFTPLDSLLNRNYMYYAWLKRTEELATCPLAIEAFPPSPNALWRETPMAPFYLLGPGAWESIILQDGFHIVNRDEGIPYEPCIKVLGSELPVL
jgi:hypothetical protein